MKLYNINALADRAEPILKEFKEQGRVLDYINENMDLLFICDNLNINILKQRLKEADAASPSEMSGLEAIKLEELQEVKNKLENRIAKISEFSLYLSNTK